MISAASVIVFTIIRLTPGDPISILLILLFSITLHWLPLSGYVSPFTSISEWFSHIIMPSIALGAGSAANISRLTRHAMLDSLNQDYVRTSRAKGLDERVTLSSPTR